MVRTPFTGLLHRAVVEALNTINEWLRLNGSHILAAILVFAVQPGVELPPLVLQLFS